MNVLLTTGIYPPDIGGPATYIPQLAYDLQKFGHNIVIVTLGTEDEQIVKKNLVIKRINRTSFVLFRLLKTMFLIRKELKKCDAVLSNGLFLETSIALKFTINRKKIRSVVKIVGDPVWERLRNKKQTELTLTEFISRRLIGSAFFLRLIFNWSWSQFNVRTSPSEEICNLVEKNLKNHKCLYIPNGVEIKNIITNKPEYDLVTVSRLVNWKNIDLVIRVAAKLHLELLIIGDGPDLQKLQELALRLKAKVSFTGKLSGQDVLPKIMKAKIFVQISDYEGLSFSLLEAMSLGLIPIVSDVPGNTAVISNFQTGLVINRDEKSLESALKLLLTNSEFSASLSRNAINEISKKYNGHVQRKKMIDLLIT